MIVQPAAIERVVAHDPSDDIFVACAIASEAEFLVSGDRHLLNIRQYGDIRILPPKAFTLLFN